MGRAPCCDKRNVKKGPWSPDEDATLKTYIETNGGTSGSWIALPTKAGLKRCGKSCRLRWLNYLRPNIKHGGFTEEEDGVILKLYNQHGSRWSTIASQLHGRTDNDVKNHWNTKLKKKMLVYYSTNNSKNQTICQTKNDRAISETENQQAPPPIINFSSSSSSSSQSIIDHDRQIPDDVVTGSVAVSSNSSRRDDQSSLLDGGSSSSNNGGDNGDGDEWGLMEDMGCGDFPPNLFYSLLFQEKINGELCL